MKLDTLQIRHFRNLQDVVLTPSPAINFLIGKNGSGKSSLLEAIHYLGFGRSFRTSKHKNVIQYQQDLFTVFCDSSLDGKGLKLGISRSLNEDTLISINGNRSNKIADLVSQVPLQIFTPQSSDILTGSPKQRRKYLDWGLFHVEPSFLKLANSYTKSLKHKNALLRVTNSSSIENVEQSSFWDQEVSTLGEELTKRRQEYVERLKSYIYSNLKQFLPEFSLEISYYRGWEKDLSLLDSLKKNVAKDRKNGFSSVGAHKADLRLKVEGLAAAEVMSRGQLRMLMAAMQLAQTQLLNDDSGKTCVFLLDDIGAELDSSKREVFIDKLLESQNQLFVTAIEKEQLDFIEKYKHKKMFHVEHGQVREEI